jgi:hypothetical protein
MGKYLTLLVFAVVFSIAASGCAHTPKRPVTQGQTAGQQQNRGTKYIAPPMPPSSLDLYKSN